MTYVRHLASMRSGTWRLVVASASEQPNFGLAVTHRWAVSGWIDLWAGTASICGRGRPASPGNLHRVQGRRVPPPGSNSLRLRCLGQAIHSRAGAGTNRDQRSRVPGGGQARSGIIWICRCRATSAESSRRADQRLPEEGSNFSTSALSTRQWLPLRVAQVWWRKGGRGLAIMCRSRQFEAITVSMVRE